jgi:hypothetical protein
MPHNNDRYKSDTRRCRETHKLHLLRTAALEDNRIIRHIGLGPAVRCATDQGLLWAGSRPYELASNSSFSGHNYTFREKRFEL